MIRSISRVGVLATVVSTVLATTAGGQVIRRPPSRPTINWAGASVGITQGFGINDGSTQSRWDFGSGLEYAARLEHPTPGGIAIGVQASYARLPLSYSTSLGTRDATAQLTQVLGVLHYGGGYSFHPVYELTAGVIGFSGFRTTGSAPQQLSSSTDFDARISLGYGFGFGLSPTAKVEIVQELGTILHQRTGLSGSSSTFPRVYVTRLGAKFAF